MIRRRLLIEQLKKKKSTALTAAGTKLSRTAGLTRSNQTNEGTATEEETKEYSVSQQRHRSSEREKTQFGRVELI